MLRPMLLLFTQEGCPACNAALPDFEKFKARNPTAMALQFDADGPYAAHFVGKRIRATPLYLLRNGDTGVAHEGRMTCDLLERWIKAATGAIS